MNGDEVPDTADDIRALADQAEAEAAEAEAFAAAARERPRAVQLRRRAELIEAKKAEAANNLAKADAPAAVAAGDDPADPVGAAVTDADEFSPEPEKFAAEPDSGPVAQTEADAAAVGTETTARHWPILRRLRRPKWSSLAAGLAIVITVAALAGSGYMIKGHNDAVRQRQRAAEFVAPAAKQKSVKTSVVALRAALSEFHPDSAVVLLFVNQSTQSKDRPEPTFTSSSVSVTLTKAGGKWMISSFTPI